MNWQTTNPRMPVRCIGYLPPSDDPDRQPGHTRWSELAQSKLRRRGS